MVLSPVDGHCSVRCLVGVNPDHHIHDYLLGCGGTTGALLLCGRLVLDPLLSHSVAKSVREALRSKANRPEPVAGTS